MKKYKLALMGATAVGKTVFFASYFYQTTQLGKGKYPVSIKHSASVKEIGRIIRKLFDERTVVEGTSTRTDISFNVDTLGMEVEFYDVPGGHTQDMEQWVEHNILPDLQKANGVLFFISAEDVMLHQDRLLEDNMVFTTAISHLRKPVDGKNMRQDVPIWFLFTKGDTVPDASIDELKSRVSGLLKAAGDTGRFVDFWKVTSMGKWLNPSLPPKDFQPENVIEPMEAMFEKMKKSMKIHITKMVAITAACLCLGWASLIGAGWGFDQYLWKSAKAQIEKFVDLSMFPEALEVITRFYDRYELPSLILPRSLSAGPQASEVIDGVYKSYEAKLYSEVRAYIEGVDPAKMPDGNPELFDAAASKIREYLKISKFYEINPGNYERVRSVENYYEAGQILFANTMNFLEDATPDDVYAALKRQLDVASRIPSSWLEGVTHKTDELLRAWVHSLPLDTAAPEDLTRFSSVADQLSEHPFMPDELKRFLGEQKRKWESQKVASWDALVSGWLREVGGFEPEKAVERLSQRLNQPGLPPAVRDKIQGSIDMHYGRLVDIWLKSDKTPEALIEILGRFPYMPELQVRRVEERVQSLIQGKVADVVSQISASKKIGDLMGQRDTVRAAKTAYGASAAVISGTFESTLLRLMESEIKACSDEAGMLASKQDFGGAKDKIDSFFSGLTSHVKSLAGDLDQDVLLKRIDLGRAEMLQLLEENEFVTCKSVFKTIRYTRDVSDIRRVIERLKGFIARWPSSSKASEAAAVQSFLEHIQGGVTVRLVILDGDFSQYYFGKEVYISVKQGGKEVAKTQIIESGLPFFNFSLSLVWNVTMSMTFEGYDEDYTSDDLLFEKTVVATGLFGYRNLTDTLSNEGNKVNIRLEHSIPDCPWE